MDYDGTLVDTSKRLNSVTKEIIIELERVIELGLKIGIATGRGNSFLDSLKEDIRSKYHSQILLGLYNGTQLIRLSDEYKKQDDGLWNIHKFINSIKNDIDCDKVCISINSTHVSIRKGNEKEREKVFLEISSRLKQYSRFIRYKRSGHSIDFFPHWGSKLSVVEAIAESIDFNILCIGDQGQAGGNDEDLLSWNTSISVGGKRPVSNSCLWLGHDKSFRESKGTLLILKNISKKGQLFSLSLK